METEPQVPASYVDSDIACIHCGYNVRGLLLDSRCPECGAAVADSLRGNLLRYADAGWVEKLRKGTSLKLWNIGLMILGGIAGSVLMSAGVPPAVHSLINLAGALLGVFASFLLTTQEPRVALSEDPMALRKVIRTFIIVAFIGSAGMYLEVLIPESDGLIAMIAGVFSLVGYAAYLAELVYYKRLAVRIPDEKLAKSTGQLTWMIGIFGTLMIAGGIFAVVNVLATGGPGGAGGPSRAFLGIMSGLGCVAVLMLLCLLWYVRLLTRYKKAFRQAIVDAGLTDTGSLPSE